MRLYLTLIVLFLNVLCNDLFAQSTPIAGSKDTKKSGDIPSASSDEHRVVINYYLPADQKEISRLEQLVGASLSFYLDGAITWDGNSAKSRKSEKEMLADLNNIVIDAVKYYEFKELNSFKGFSEEFKTLLHDAATAKYKAQSGSTQQKDAQERYFFFQKKMSDLKLRANVEVGNFGSENLLLLKGSEEAIVDQQTKDSLLRALHFDPNLTLNPESNEYSEATIALLSVGDESVLYPEMAINPNDKDSLNFNEQILKMLQANNEKLDKMQGEINDLRAEQMRQWQASQEKTNQELQTQIEDLRSMILDLVKMNTGGAITSVGNEIITGPEITNLPDAINIYFEKGQVVLNTNAQLSLNEVVDIMARNPRMKVVVTGYADKTGNEDTNLKLSKARAQQVKRFLSESGLEENRFITRYLGDTNSANTNPQDRKVTLTFVAR